MASGKCLICKAKCFDADDGKLWEDLWMKVSGSIKWVCRDCMSVLMAKKNQGNNVYGEERKEAVESEPPKPNDPEMVEMDLGLHAADEVETKHAVELDEK